MRDLVDAVGPPLDGPLPTTERFIWLLKKNLSRKKENRLSEEELNELKRVRDRISEQQWTMFLEQAKRLREREKVLSKKEREEKEFLEEQLVMSQKQRLDFEWAQEQSRLQRLSEASGNVSNVGTPWSRSRPSDDSALRSGDLFSPAPGFDSGSASAPSAPSSSSVSARTIIRYAPTAVSQPSRIDASPLPANRTLQDGVGAKAAGAAFAPAPHSTEPAALAFAVGSVISVREHERIILGYQRQIQELQSASQIAAEQFHMEIDAARHRLEHATADAQAADSRGKARLQEAEDTIAALRSSLKETQNELLAGRQVKDRPVQRSSDAPSHGPAPATVPAGAVAGGASVDPERRIMELEARLLTMIKAQETLATTHSIEEENLRRNNTGLQRSCDELGRQKDLLLLQLRDGETKQKEACGNYERQIRELKLRLESFLEATAGTTVSSTASGPALSPLKEPSHGEERTHIDSTSSQGGQQWQQLYLQARDDNENLRNDMSQYEIESRRLHHRLHSLQSSLMSVRPGLSQARDQSAGLRSRQHELRKTVVDLLQSFEAELVSFSVEFARCWALHIKNSEFLLRSRGVREVGRPEAARSSSISIAAAASPRREDPAPAFAPELPRRAVVEPKAPGAVVESAGAAAAEEMGAVNVFVRIRPVSSHHRVFPIDMIGENAVRMCTNGRDQRTAVVDRVFGESATQTDIATGILDASDEILAGKTVTFIAFGETGSGKSFTLDGTVAHPGISSRVVAELFASLEAKQERQPARVEVQMAACEFCGETCRDLLETRPSKRVVHNDIGIADLFHEMVASAGDFERLKSLAHSKRSVAREGLVSFGVRKTSSTDQPNPRSHFVVSMRIRSSNASAVVAEGRLTFVDLAGSESLTHTTVSDVQMGLSLAGAASSATNEVMKESVRVRKGLIALGDVLVALSHKQPHVPYRNSKLTVALQDCLRRDATVALFATVHPGVEHAQQSLKTLLFASRVKSIHVSLGLPTINLAPDARQPSQDLGSDALLSLAESPSGASTAVSVSHRGAVHH